MRAFQVKRALLTAVTFLILFDEAFAQNASGNNPRPPINTDESKVVPYTLPDPLTFPDGTKVTSPAMWWTKRRPEVLDLFAQQVYGRTPAKHV
ncbi:MAG TPA: hypothetical protein VG168_06110, partial [Bryobacteraceae bacterium]|nr:hypothetical protein [Bryobacteraceae bacterium]